MERDLTVGSVPKQLLSFAAPLFLANLLQSLYSIVDMAVVGRFVGSAGSRRSAAPPSQLYHPVGLHRRHHGRRGAHRAV
ncbi:MAG: hypothetical protein ACLVL7_01425 [Anaerotruncus massiliensis (ex Togo et al. 2019)]